MKIPGLRPADALVQGLAHYGRMLDKIRLAQAGTLPEGYLLGEGDFTWWDSRCCRLLGVPYADLRSRVESGATDEEVLEWAFATGSKPTGEQIQIWSTFILKRGWRDEASAGLEADKLAAGFGDRDDILTFADLQKAEES